MKIECNTASALMRTYFNYPISSNVKDAILSHLIICPKCKKMYEDYAKAVGKKFELNEDIEKLLAQYDEEVDDMSDNENVSKTKKRSYTDMAKEKDISSLMNIQSVREYFKEQYDVNDRAYAECIAKFGWYVTEKMCKTIDTLEKLYNLSGGSDNDEVNNDAEK